MASGDMINYSIRPAKTVERKIIKDFLSKMTVFDNMRNYRYIGFGSKYFSDFKLFHREINIDDMISIESDIESKEKYKFNKPYDCIELKMGKSSDILVDIEYSKKYICWLDYDYSINQSVLDDLDILISNLLSGSIIIISLNTIPYKIGQLRDEFKDKDAKHSELLVRKLNKWYPPHNPTGRFNLSVRSSKEEVS